MIIRKIILVFNLPVILVFLIGLELHLLANMPPDKQHMMVHKYGEKLYQSKGLSGIAFCTDAYGFGCFHGFFSKAVARMGIGVVAELDQTCIAKFGLQGLGCPHGIGHGLGEYFGPLKLNEQLAVCETLSWQGVYHGCQSGVFMEYNYPKTTRIYKETEAFDPCFRVPKKFQHACLLELPAWWWDVFSHNVQKMGTLCGTIGEVEFRQSCYAGIGSGFTGRVEYALPVVLANCRLMPDALTETWCRAGAAWAFFADTRYREQAASVCDGLASENRQRCSQGYQHISRGEHI